jgi:hypothetical protein
MIALLNRGCRLACGVATSTQGSSVICTIRPTRLLRSRYCSSSGLRARQYQDHTGNNFMRIRSLVGILALAAAALGGPTLLVSPAHTQAQAKNFCSDWLFVGDVCQAIEACSEAPDDPACQPQPNTLPSTEQRSIP